MKVAIIDKDGLLSTNLAVVEEKLRSSGYAIALLRNGSSAMPVAIAWLEDLVRNPVYESDAGLLLDLVRAAGSKFVYIQLDRLDTLPIPSSLTNNSPAKGYRNV